MGLNANTKVNIKQQNEHQVPNIERVRKNDQNDPIIASEPRRFGSNMGIQPNAANQNETQTRFQTK